MTAVKNELHQSLLGVAGLNPFLMHNSSSRLAMFATHVSQALVLEGATVCRTSSLMEREYAKYTHSIKMPCNANVLKVIEKYPKTLADGSIKENPLYTIIYENLDHPLREIGIINLTRYHCVHQYFGFNYKYNPIVNELRTGLHIPAGTVLAYSPAITDDGDHRYGVGVQLALMPLPGVIEDGIIVYEHALPKFKTKGYGKRIYSFGKNRYPLNLYGTEQNYKPFPDIGDRIRADGLLLASREYDEFLAVVGMTPKALLEPTQFDRTEYAIPNARVTDIVIRKGSNLRTNLPTGMNEQVLKYYRRIHQYHENIQTEYRKHKARLKDKLAVTPEFQRLLVEGAVITNPEPKNRIINVLNTQPIDEWQVEIHFEYDITPAIGFKMTDRSGCKGVLVEIRPSHEAPVDADGNRCDIVMDADSNIKRMVGGRIAEQLLNASARALQIRLDGMLGDRSQERIDYTFEQVMEFYRIVSPRMHEAVIASGVENDKLEHIENLIEDGFYFWLPTDNPSLYADSLWELIKKFPPCYGPVTYTGNAGVSVTTELPVLIGEVYFMMLEKIANLWTGVASPQLQHFGIPAKISKVDKYSSPGRNNPVRIFGETEIRLAASVVGGDVASEILDQTNNPAAHRFIVDAIYRADKPTNIIRVIDRKVVPRGNGRIVSYVRHMLECNGFKFVEGAKL